MYYALAVNGRWCREYMEADQLVIDISKNGKKKGYSGVFGKSWLLNMMKKGDSMEMAGH